MFTNYGFAGNALDWQGSIRARAGFAFDRALIYATGGFAFAGLSDGFGIVGGDDDTLTGWTLGRALWNEFFANRDWPMAATVASALLLVLAVPMALLRARQ